MISGYKATPTKCGNTTVFGNVLNLCFLSQHVVGYCKEAGWKLTCISEGSRRNLPILRFGWRKTEKLFSFSLRGVACGTQWFCLEDSSVLIRYKRLIYQIVTSLLNLSVRQCANLSLRIKCRHCKQYNKGISCFSLMYHSKQLPCSIKKLACNV